jgi:hypothetical protein
MQEMGVACSKQAGDEKYQFSVGKPDGKRQLERPGVYRRLILEGILNK